MVTFTTAVNGKPLRFERNRTTAEGLGAGGSSVRLRSESGLGGMSSLARAPTSLSTRRPSSVAYPSRACGWQTSGRLLRA
jgi:hypothetical protein